MTMNKKHLLIYMNSIQKIPIIKNEIVSSISLKLPKLIAENIKLIDFEPSNLSHYLLFIEFMFKISLLENELQQFKQQPIRIFQNNYKDIIFIDELETKFVMKEFYSKKNILIAISYYLNDFGEYFDTQIVLQQNIFHSALELLIITIQSNLLQKRLNISNLKIISIIYNQIISNMHQNFEFYDIDTKGEIKILYKTIPLDIPTLQIKNLVPSDKSYIKLSDIARLTKDTPKITIGTGKPNVIYRPFTNEIVPKPETPISNVKSIPSKVTPKVVNKPIQPLITKSVSKTTTQRMNEYIVLSSNIENYSLGIDYNTIWVFPPKISVQIITDKYKIENLKTFIKELDENKLVPVQSCFGLRVNTHYPIEMMSINNIKYTKYTKTEEPILIKNVNNH